MKWKICIFTLCLSLIGNLYAQDLRSIVIEDEEMQLEWQRYLAAQAIDESSLSEEEKLLYLASVKEGLIMRKVLLTLAESHDLIPTELEVEQEYERVRSMIPDPQIWQQLLDEQFYTEDTFRQYLSESKSIDLWLSKEVLSKVEISPDEAKQYYDSHPEEFLRDDGTTLSFEEVQESLEAFLYEQKAQSAVAAYMERVRGAIQNNP